MNVTIDGAHVLGSPCPLVMMGANPEISACEVSGIGLSKAIAGKRSSASSSGINIITRRCLALEGGDDIAAPKKKDRFGSATSQWIGDEHVTKEAFIRAEYLVCDGWELIR